MAEAICVEKCTYGEKPRLYEVGDRLSYEGDECPKCFEPLETPAAETPAAEAEKEYTVRALADELEVDAAKVKALAGKARQDAVLTPEEVVQVRTALETPAAETPAAEAPAAEAPAAEAGKE